MSATKEVDASPASSISQAAEKTTDENTQELAAYESEKQQTPAAATADVEEPWATGPKLWLITTAVTLVCLIILLDVSIVSTATPKITSQFHSLQDVGWYGAAYQLCSGTLQPLTGKIYSNFQLKWTFLVFFAVFELGSLLCAVSTSSNMFIVSRAVAGLGSSGLTNGALTIIASIAPMPKRPALMAVVFGVGQLGLAGGPLIGGLFTQFVSWRWCFYINLPVGGVVAVFLLFVSIPDQVRKPPPREVVRDLHNVLDLIGFAIFAPAAVMLLLALQWGGNQYAWGSSVVIGLFCGSGATFLVWGVWSHHKKDAAMIPFRMVRERVVWSSCINQACIASAMFVMSYYLPVYFQGVRGKRPAISGVDLLPSILSQLFAAVVSAKLVQRFGYYLPWAVASGIMSSIGYGVMSTLTPSTSTADWAGFQVLTGLGRGCGFQMSLVAVQNMLAPAQIPTAMAVLMFAQTFGGALSLSFADTIFTNSLRALIGRDAPGVDAAAIINAGAYSFRDAVRDPGQLEGVLRAYAQSIDRVFYYAAAVSVVAFAVSWLMGWRDIRDNKSGKKKAEAQDG